MSFEHFKTQPYAHQLAAFEQSKDAPYWGILFEQRCGKTKVAIDTAVYQYMQGNITAMLIIAPNNVHCNWIRDEIPTHMSDCVNPMTVLWKSGKMDSKKATRALDDLLSHKGLAVLAVNIDAIITTKLRDYLTRFYRARTVMAIVDESLDISGASSKRSEIAMKIGQRSKLRRILDGTPADASPLGLYSQCEFLTPGALGFTNFFAYKAHYACLVTQDVGEHDRLCPTCLGQPRAEPCLRCHGTRYVGNREILKVDGYKNLDELNKRLMGFSSRVTRAQCADMPPKIYQKAYFDLTKTQRATYNQMRDDALAELRGSSCSAQLALTKLLRLQQIASNHLPVGNEFVTCPKCHGNVDEGCDLCFDTGLVPDTKRILTVDEEHDPRAEALKQAVGQLPTQGIIWARFKPDVDNAVKVMRSLNKKVGRYDGATSMEEREQVKRAFQAGSLDCIVGSARAGGRGIDLSGADWVAYYSHDWPLRHRRQSEDRAQSLKKTSSVLYIDLVAMDTVDEKILETLRNNKSFSDLVTGDPSVPWL